MRLNDLRRTTSFRLALLFLLLFGTSSLVLFEFIHVQTSGYLVGRIDDWLGREQAILLQVDHDELVRRLDGRATSDSQLERPAVLFSPDGAHLAGSRLAALPPVVRSGRLAGRPFNYLMDDGIELQRYRALVRTLPDGDLLFLAETTRGVEDFNRVLVSAIIWGTLVTALLGLAGAMITGQSAIRRIDAVTLAIRRIIEGDLSGRLPTQGDSGDLDRLVHVVNGMLDEIEWLMQQVKGVCDNIAHDLRTPLTRLLAGLNRAKRRANSVAEYEAAVDEATEEIEALLRTFAAMLRISEAEDAARRAGFETSDLHRIASDVVELYEPMADVRGLRLTLVAEGDACPKMPGDPSLLFAAIANLVDNAIKFTPAGEAGEVTVRLFDDGARLGVSVTDNGPGIPAAQREAVLRRFHRAEASRSTPGNGLGFSLVAAIAKLHGMELVIEDVAHGCRVVLSWQDPAKTPAAMAQAARTRRSPRRLLAGLTRPA